MCGIYLELKKNKISNQNILRACNNIFLRGPDKLLKDQFLEKKLFIANSVLSITGKVKKNRKNLFFSKSKRYVISFNGEIFNYKSLNNKFKIFNHKEYTDTEILVNLFEKIKPEKIPLLLDGMYSFVVFDKKHKKLFFAFDPQGERKLFYHKKQDEIIVASTPEVIVKNLKNEVKFNNKKLESYFYTRHLTQYKETIYESIKIFENGCLYIYDINSDNLEKKKIDNPLNWISKRKYLKFKNLRPNKVEGYFARLLRNTIDKLLPDIKFACVFSGGIDSSLVGNYLKDKKNLDFYYCLNHVGKDSITENIGKFQKYLKKKIIKRNVYASSYFQDLRKTYKNIFLPFITHDLVGHEMVFNYIKNKDVKVLFWAGGADEIFGGYEAYSNLKFNLDFNVSPYSKFKKKNTNTLDQIESEKIWLRAFNKYNKFLDKKESRMQASLFTDYFYGSVATHNITTHILSGQNSIELRNIFMNKKVISDTINLPIKYKINLNSKKMVFKNKPILKKLFINLYSKKLLFKKQGFSGFPNESVKFLNKKELFEIKKIKKNKVFNRSTEWKIYNLFYFKKYISKNLKLDKIVNNCLF